MARSLTPPVAIVQKSLTLFAPRIVVALIISLLTTHYSLLVAESDTHGALSHEYLFAPNKTFPYFESVSQLDATSPATYSPQNAAMLAQCSMLIYVKEPDFIEEKLTSAGFTDIQFFDTLGTYAFLAESPEHIVITFRGTETGDQTDYFTDAKFLHRDFTENGRAHAGFLDALSHVQDALQTSLASRLEAAPNKTVWLAGHSLGAALATLFGIQNFDSVDAIYTIGSPRSVNKSLAEHWHESLPIFRVVNNNDIITRLPGPPFYQHIGPTYFLAADGQLITDPPKPRVWRERLKGHGKLTKRLFEEHWSEKDFTAIPSDYFVDHSTRLYTEHLIALAQK
ncbi:Lipase family [Verrucomicrobiia bacterium DG1235]|nr:Lipase family [Verrucomicrobiae bacterium DG1235]